MLEDDKASVQAGGQMECSGWGAVWAQLAGGLVQGQGGEVRPYSFLVHGTWLSRYLVPCTWLYSYLVPETWIFVYLVPSM